MFKRNDKAADRKFRGFSLQMSSRLVFKTLQLFAWLHTNLSIHFWQPLLVMAAAK